MLPPENTVILLSDGGKRMPAKALCVKAWLQRWSSRCSRRPICNCIYVLGASCQMRAAFACIRINNYTKLIDDYAENGGPGEVWLLCRFYHESLRTWIKTIVNKFAISNCAALILGVYAFRSYLKLICEYKIHSLPTKKVSGAKDHGKNYIKARPPGPPSFA